MCNLLIPLCPFVLHSVTTSSQYQQPQCSSDAKILFSYLSKKPYDSPSSSSGHFSSQKPPKPLAQKTTRLYKRTNWHTCACFFRHVAVLHPMPGPSRPTFGMSHKYCAKCSNAAKTLKPMRMGGLGDKTDPYWNRCIFAGARGVFENGFGENFDVTGGNMNLSTPAGRVQERYALPTPKQRQPDQFDHIDSLNASSGELLLEDDGRFQYQERGNWQNSHQSKDSSRAGWTSNNDWRKQYRSYPSKTPTPTYGEDLDRYISTTYGD